MFCLGFASVVEYVLFPGELFFGLLCVFIQIRGIDGLRPGSVGVDHVVVQDLRIEIEVNVGRPASFRSR